MRGPFGLIGVGAVFTLVGCGESDPFSRQAVGGTVSYKGKPLVYGQIEFDPAAGQKTPLTLEIADGRFTTDKARGLSAGKYSIRISGFDTPLPKPNPDVPGQMSGPMPKPVVPEKYNTKSTLSVEIKVGEKNELKFDLD